MELSEIVQSFIEQPIPLWELNATEGVVQMKWRQLEQRNILFRTGNKQRKVHAQANT